MLSPLAPSAPAFEHRTDRAAVLAISSPQPRLSWTIDQAPERWRQTAYEVEITRSGTTERHLVHGADQVLVPWPTAALAARERAAVRVRVANVEEWSEWSPASIVEAGLLSESDWTARFITPAGIGQEGGRAPVLEGALEVPGTIVSARLYATAHGVYVPSLNGRRVDDTVLAPGWTSYHHRLRYHAYDVTELVQEGANTISVLLGNGWYRGRLGYTNDRALYGHTLALLAQLEVTTTDGRVHVLSTDDTWTAHESDILADDLYDGQTTDLRLTGSTTPEVGVRILEADTGVLVAPDGPPMRPTGTLPAVSVWQSPAGRTLVDFGQNAVGWVRLRVRGLPAGTEVTIRHAEVLEHDELGTEPLRSARATDTYVVAGLDEEVLEPQLTLHGFRYAEVSGVPGLVADDLELVVIGSDLRRTGWFSTSHELLNRFHENVVWGTRGNFVDVPTDCPQRDERLGWTGDIQVFSPTATYLFDTAGFLTSWLDDLRAEQRPDGSVPHVVPDVNGNVLAFTPAAAWGDAATIVPWTLFQRTGDRELLARQLPSMCAWVDRVEGLAGPSRLWRGGFQYGDWLDPTAPEDSAAKAKADPDVVATAHFARSSWLVAHAAQVVGRDDVAERYLRLFDEVRTAFVRAFVTPAGLVHSDSQTGYALAIQWDLLENDEQRRTAGNRLADLVRANGFRIGTGFVGTPLVCDALTSTGHVDTAYRLLLQTECPSWLYPVTMGATTIWERWDSMLPDGTINGSGMTSFNHYALGAVADWLHRTVAGLAPAAPGYRRVLVKPRPTAELASASARHLSPLGPIQVSWQRAGGRFVLDLDVPVGSSAEVHLPGASAPVDVAHGHHRWEVADPVGEATFDWATATVRELLDHPAAWADVVSAAVRNGIRDETEVSGRLQSYLDAPARRVGECLAPDERFNGAMDLRNAMAAVQSQNAPVASSRP